MTLQSRTSAALGTRVGVPSRPPRQEDSSAEKESREENGLSGHGHGHRPRIKSGPGTGRRPILTLADRLLATLLHHGSGLPQVTIAELFGVRPETINRRMRETRQLLDQAGHPIHPGPHRLATLADLHALAIAEGIHPNAKPAS